MPQEPQHQRAAMRRAACLAWQVMRGFVAESGVQYVIVPATDKPGQTGPFSLGVYAEHEVKFRKIADSHEARAATTCSVQAPSFITRQQDENQLRKIADSHMPLRALLATSLLHSRQQGRATGRCVRARVCPSANAVAAAARSARRMDRGARGRRPPERRVAPQSAVHDFGRSQRRSRRRRQWLARPPRPLAARRSLRRPRCTNASSRPRVHARREPTLKLLRRGATGA